MLVMGGSPSRVVKAIEIDLPHPRTWEVLTSERYLEIKEEIMELLYKDQTVESLAQ